MMLMANSVEHTPSRDEDEADAFASGSDLGDEPLSSFLFSSVSFDLRLSRCLLLFRGDACLLLAFSLEREKRSLHAWTTPE